MGGCISLVSQKYLLGFTVVKICTYLGSQWAILKSKESRVTNMSVSNRTWIFGNHPAGNPFGKRISLDLDNGQINKYEFGFGFGLVEGTDSPHEHLGVGEQWQGQ